MIINTIVKVCTQTAKKKRHELQKSVPMNTYLIKTGIGGFDFDDNHCKKTKRKIWTQTILGSPVYP